MVMPQPDFDPKTLVWYPLFSLILFLILYLGFDVPFYTLFILLFLIIVYYLIFIIYEMKRK